MTKGGRGYVSRPQTAALGRTYRGCRTGSRVKASYPIRSRSKP